MPNPRLSRNTWPIPGVLAILLLPSVAAKASPAGDPAREQVIRIVDQIRRADYEGDRAALAKLRLQLTPFIVNKELSSRVRYWRGFALWRRAINGFNGHVDPKELQSDLMQAMDDFDEAIAKDPNFVDAKVAALGCAGYLAFGTGEKDPERIKQWIAKGHELQSQAQAAEPDNPRLMWVDGPGVWFTPPERGGGQAKAIEVYEKGLASIRKSKTTPADGLEPMWGEPELLMSLAWSQLNRTTPDLEAAEQDARAALQMVPYWHYLRDILLPQIQEARRKAELAPRK